MSSATAESRRRSARAFIRERCKQNPPFVHALLEDAKVTAASRNERSRFRSRRDATVQTLRLLYVTDAFLALAFYRAKSRLLAHRVPVLPRVAHRLAMATAQVSIGDPVILHPGVYLAHGQIVIDGLTEVHSGTAILPFVTIGLKTGSLVGPTIGPDVRIGTGAKVLGPVRVGARARIGANAVVLDHVPDDATAVGIPAKVTS